MRQILNEVGIVIVLFFCLCVLILLIHTPRHIPTSTGFERHIQNRIKAADSMAITAQEKAVRARTEGGVE